MMECTDRHFRYFVRLLSKKTFLYTEMVTTGAVIHGIQDRVLGYNECEHPIGIQLGGSDPIDMATSAKLAEDLGYDEVNINVGCPSSRVQVGGIGACLMNQAGLVAECVDAMKQQVQIPVTIKTRIGIDNNDSYEFLVDFIETTSKSGVDTYIVHARKAWLKGLSPKENREKPPLHYDVVERLKQDYPHLEIILNGGIQSIEDSVQHLKVFDGVMLGREPYRDPFMLSRVDSEIFGEPATEVQRKDVLEQFVPYVEKQIAKGIRMNAVVRHITGFFLGQKGAKRWRTHLSEGALRSDASIDVLKEAMELVR
jgi:tRNA-dihydrouridine synthase A